MVSVIRRVWLWFRGVLDAALFPETKGEVGDDTIAMLEHAEDEGLSEEMEAISEAEDEELDIDSCIAFIGHINLPTRVAVRDARKIVWDMVACNEVADYYEMMGLLKESDDVARMEHRDSHVRLSAVGPLITAIHKHCLVSSTVMTEHAMVHADDPDDQALRVRILTSNYEEHFAVGIALVSNLLDQGAIEYIEDWEEEMEDE